MKKKAPLVLILDVDGVMTTGQFIYTEKGKNAKIFGPDDHDALSILKDYIQIRFITGDKKGYKISKKRIVDHMGFKLDLVNTVSRVSWIKRNYKLNDVIYMGDGLFDSLVMKKVKYSICPVNGNEETKKFANYITKRSGGDRAVSEACIHIMNKFFKKFSLDDLPKNKVMSGSWKI